MALSGAGSYDGQASSSAARPMTAGILRWTLVCGPLDLAGSACFRGQGDDLAVAKLSWQQISALAVELYRKTVTAHRGDPGKPLTGSRCSVAQGTPLAGAAQKSHAHNVRASNAREKPSNGSSMSSSAPMIRRSNC